MFALGMWEDTQEISVLDVDQVKGQGNELKAKWGGKFYPIKILMKSNDDKWLESLRVTVDGVIVMENDESAVLLKKSKRKMLQKLDKASKKSFEESRDKQRVSILNSVSIFDEESTTASNEIPQQQEQISAKEKNKDPVGSRNHVNLAMDTSVSKSSESTTSTARADNDGSDGNLVLQSVKPGSSKANNIPNSPVNNDSIQQSPQFLKISADDMKKIESFLTLARTHNLEQKDVETLSSKKSGGKSGPKTMKNELVPLFEGSTVRVAEWKLKTHTETYKKNARSLIRKLTLEILGEPTLKTSSPTGKGGWTPFPGDVLADVELYVRQNVRKPFRITHEEYMRVLTAQCSALRNKDNPNAKEGKKEVEVPKKSLKRQKIDRTIPNKSSESEEFDDDSGNDELDDDEPVVKKSKTGPGDLRDGSALKYSRKESKKKENKDLTNNSNKIEVRKDRRKQDSNRKLDNGKREKIDMNGKKNQEINNKNRMRAAGKSSKREEIDFTGTGESSESEESDDDTENNESDGDEKVTKKNKTGSRKLHDGCGSKSTRKEKKVLKQDDNSSTDSESNEQGNQERRQDTNCKLDDEEWKTLNINKRRIQETGKKMVEEDSEKGEDSTETRQIAHDVAQEVCEPNFKAKDISIISNRANQEIHREYQEGEVAATENGDIAQPPHSTIVEEMVKSNSELDEMKEKMCESGEDLANISENGKMNDRTLTQEGEVEPYNLIQSSIGTPRELELVRRIAELEKQLQMKNVEEDMTNSVEQETTRKLRQTSQYQKRRNSKDDSLQTRKKSKK